jgi:hypothetical protein
MSPEERELYAPHLAGQRAVLAKLQAQTRPPEIVAAAVERALTRRRPRSRMVVGNDARDLVAMKTALPTPLMDAVWARGLRLPAPPRNGHGATTADFLVVDRHDGETLAMTTSRSSSSSPLDPRFELMISNVFGQANAGKTNTKGMPGMLQLALSDLRSKEGAVPPMPTGVHDDSSGMAGFGSAGW